MRIKFLVLSLGLSAGFVLGGACREDFPEHCANLEGDDTCAARGGGVFCSSCNTDSDGCVIEQPSAECRWPGPGTGGATDGVDSLGSTGLEGTTGANPTGTADPSSSTGENVDSESGVIPGCTEHADCNDDAPICKNGTCEACEEGVESDDEACAERDPATPVCSNGVCDECIRDDAGVCTSCTEHEHCGLAGCNFYTNECLPQTAVVEVGPGLAITSITSALENPVLQAGGTIRLHPGTYTESVNIMDGRVVAILGVESEFPTWTPETMHQLRVTHGTVLLDRLSISDSVTTSHAISLGSAGVGESRVWIDRSRVVKNHGGGVFVGGVSELTMRNCFVGDVFDGGTGLGAQDVLRINGGSARVRYTTIVASDQNNVEALRCLGGGAAEVSDSILVKIGTGATFEANEGCVPVFDRCAADDGIPGTYFVGEESDTWFANREEGNYSLTPVGADVFANIALWNQGDPTTDILGTPRPTVEGTPDYPGAHVP